MGKAINSTNNPGRESLQASRKPTLTTANLDLTLLPDVSTPHFAVLNLASQIFSGIFWSHHGPFPYRSHPEQHCDRNRRLRRDHAGCVSFRSALD
jgi:hypothetical protein